MRRPAAAAAAAVPMFAATLLAIPLAAAQPGASTTAVQVEAVPAYNAPGATAPIVPATPPPSTPPAAAAASALPAAGELTGIARRTADDAGAGRAYFARSALTAPRGTIAVDVRAPTAPGMFGGVSAALTDRIEVGVGALMIIEEESLLAFNGKLQLYRGERAALAATIDLIRNPNEPDDNDTLFMPSLVASFCTGGTACGTLVSLHLTALTFEDEEELPVFAGVSFATGGKRKVIGELHVNQSEDGEETLFGGFIGGRFGGAKTAFDVGLAFGGVTEEDDCDGCGGGGGEFFPFPFVGLSTRL